MIQAVNMTDMKGSMDDFVRKLTCPGEACGTLRYSLHAVTKLRTWLLASKSVHANAAGSPSVSVQHQERTGEAKVRAVLHTE